MANQVASDRAMRLLMWTGIAFAVTMIAMVLSLVLNHPPAMLGMLLGLIFLGAGILTFFLYLAACDALARSKGYNPVIVATFLLAGLAIIVPVLVIAIITPLVLILLLPDISPAGKA